ncbi:MAG: hypothetical protein OHK0039_10680 [Bacteroidia bacterium]
MPTSFFAQQRVLHMAICSGAAVFLLVVAFVQRELNNAAGGALAEVFLPLSIGLGVAAVVGGNYLFQRGTAGLHAGQPLAKRLQRLRNLSLIRLAMTEAPTLIACVGYLFSGTLYLLIVAVVLLAWMLMLRPTRDLLVNTLRLQPEEMAAVFGA